MRRRKLLTASAVTVAALAGCIGDDEAGEGSEPEDNGESQNGGEADGDAVAIVEEFYDAYNDDDLETVNELSTEAYTQGFGDISEEDFEEFGGLENMQWTIDEIQVERESAELVEAHAHVSVATPVGDGEDVDYFLLVPEDDTWRYDMFLPEQIRQDLDQEEIDGAMQREP